MMLFIPMMYPFHNWRPVSPYVTFSKWNTDIEIVVCFIGILQMFIFYIHCSMKMLACFLMNHLNSKFIMDGCKYPASLTCSKFSSRCFGSAFLYDHSILWLPEASHFLFSSTFQVSLFAFSSTAFSFGMSLLTKGPQRCLSLC